MTEPDPQPASEGGSDAVPETPLYHYPIQLTSAACVECSAVREEEAADRPSTLKVDGDVAITPLLEEGKAFAARVTVAATAPIADEGIARIRVVVQGDFRSEAPIDREHYEAFVAYTPIALLWPYARSYVDELGRMLGVTLPPLPTLQGLSALQRSEGESEAPSPTEE